MTALSGAALTNVLDAIRAAGAADHWPLADEIARDHKIRACRMCLAKPRRRRVPEHVARWFCADCFQKYRERNLHIVTIYARPYGNDETGTGALANPYATLARAIFDIPKNNIGARYTVDATGVTT